MTIKGKRVYPHVPTIADYSTQQTARLLWDRVHDLDELLRSAQGTIKSLTDTTAQQAQTIERIRRMAAQALATAQLTKKEKVAAGEAAAGEGAEGGGKDDLGLGAAGCSAAGSDGHLTGTFERTVSNAGKIVCGVGNEFPDLLAATATRAEREANRSELLSRMVWHLNEAGFPAARYGTPGSVEWKFNLLFDCLALDGSGPMREYAYLVTTYDPPDDPWDTTHTYTTQMKCNGQSPGVTTTPDPGTAD